MSNRKKENVKIQINSLEALERLIGNDTQLETELRQSVVENFATKHLKSLVRDDQYSKWVERARKEFFEKTPEWHLKLTDDMKFAFGAEMNQLIDMWVKDYAKSQEEKLRERLDKVHNDIEERLKEFNLRLQRKLEIKTDTEIEQLINKWMNNKLRQIIH